ncbi:MAG TPA: hypothetical protein VKY32_07945 [Flavobacterium sp.]|nr:hypothetical protein [Flavobacterium sp.]
MKKMRRNIGVFSMLFMATTGYAQDENTTKLYGGLGMGLDYGGIAGAKIEYLPIKNLGFFAGAGYNLLSAGWNVGVSYKIFLNEKLSINPMAFYGYNGVSIVEGASHYNMTSYGATVGANVDIKMGNKGNKLSAGLFVPFRSKKFMDNYDAMKNDSRISIENGLLPVAFSVGFNFALGNN